MPDNRYGEAPSAAHRTQVGYARRAATLFDGVSEINVLELGPDIGSLSGELGRIAKVRHLSLVEPNIAIHDELFASVADKVDIVQISRYLSELSSADNIDLIVAVHVLDHLLDLDETLQMVHQLLKNGGIFFAVVHNEKSLLRKMLGRRWPPFCLQHPQLFSKETLMACLGSREFEFLHQGRTVNWVSARQALSLTMTIFLGRPLDRPISWLDNIKMPIITGNQFIVVRKRSVPKFRSTNSRKLRR